MDEDGTSRVDKYPSSAPGAGQEPHIHVVPYCPMAVWRLEARLRQTEQYSRLDSWISSSSTYWCLVFSYRLELWQSWSRVRAGCPHRPRQESLLQTSAPSCLLTQLFLCWSFVSSSSFLWTFFLCPFSFAAVPEWCVSCERCVAPRGAQLPVPRSLYVGRWPFAGASLNLAGFIDWWNLAGGVAMATAFDFEFLSFGCYTASIGGARPTKGSAKCCCFF